MAQRKRKSQKKHATVIVLVGTVGHETKHRAATLKQALKLAEKARLPAACTVKWAKPYKLPSGQVAGGEGKITCANGGVMDGQGIRYIGLRTNPLGWRPSRSWSSFRRKPARQPKKKRGK